MLENNKNLSESLIKFARDYFNNDIAKAQEHLLESALQKHGYLSSVNKKTQINKNFGQANAELQAFILEIADKVYAGKYTRAVMVLLEIALLKNKDNIQMHYVFKEALNKEISLDTLLRRQLRAKNVKFILSYSEYDQQVINDFVNFCRDNDMRTNKAFNYLINLSFQMYIEILEVNK